MFESGVDGQGMDLKLTLAGPATVTKRGVDRACLTGNKAARFKEVNARDGFYATVNALKDEARFM